jgi:hypothetical protein
MTATVLSQRLVTNELLTLLRASGETIGDGVAPLDAPQRYGVLMFLSASGYESLEPEHDLWCEYRVWSIGRDPSDASGRSSGPRMDAEELAHITRSILLDREVLIEGLGWRVGGRQWLASEAQAEGDITSVIDDYRFLVTPVV